jgi:hypothetical protein
VDHLRLYLDVLDEYLSKKPAATTNWREIWETVGSVDDEQWEQIKTRLRASHDKVLSIMNSVEAWDSDHEIGGALAILAHTAYHLGGIRVTLGAIRGRAQQSDPMPPDPS